MKKWISIGILFLFLIGCSKPNYVVDNIEKYHTSFFEIQPIDDLEISNFNIGYDNDNWFISGDVKNTSNYSRYIMSIQITLFDDEANVVANTYFYIDREVSINESFPIYILVIGDLSSVTKVELAVL